MIHRNMAFFAALVLLVGGSGLRAGNEQKVSPSDQLQFQQKNAQAQMQELQERMYRLAELTRPSEPDDAARLLMAVRKAREQLILEQMKSALELLASNDYTHAADEQAQIIRKLEELKKLLTSTDLDLQLQLEKLRALNQAIAKLDAATKEERRLRDLSGKLAGQKPLDPSSMQGPRHDQEHNRRATENIAQTVKGLGGSASKGGDALGGACQSMSLAEGSLADTKPSDAKGRQGDAIKSMQQARKQLVEERNQIMLELERMVRSQVVQNLTEMLERQKSIRAGTELAIHRMNSGQRETLVKLKQLGNAETAIVRIADQTIALIEETNFSVALPPALRRVQHKCAVIAASLDDAKADVPLIEKQKQVERDLQDLLDTFKQLASSRMSETSCNGCKGDANKLLAELKTVRMMQLRVNDDTKTVDGERDDHPVAADLPGNINPMLKDKILAVRDAQAEVRDALDHINQQLTAPDEPDDADEPAQQEDER